LPYDVEKIQEVKTGYFALKNSSILIFTISLFQVPVQAVESDSSSTPFTWPGMDSNRETNPLDKIQIEFKTSTTDFQKGFFNPEAIRMTGFQMRYPAD